MSYTIISVPNYQQFLKILRTKHNGQTIIINTQNTSIISFLESVQQANGLIVDFDGTVHAGNQWSGIRNLMTPECKAEGKKDLERYFREENRTHQDNLDFLDRTIKRIISSRIQIKDVISAGKLLHPRGGAIDFIQSFDEGTTAIVSFGLFTTISSWLETHSLLGTKVFSTRLVQRDGFISGYIKSSVVVDGIKGQCARNFQASINLHPEKTIILGDAPTDLQMMTPENIAILIIPKIDPDIGRMEYRLRGLDKLWSNVSAVLISDTLSPLLDIRKNG